MRTCGFVDKVRFYNLTVNMRRLYICVDSLESCSQIYLKRKIS